MEKAPRRSSNLDFGAPTAPLWPAFGTWTAGTRNHRRLRIDFPRRLRPRNQPTPGGASRQDLCGQLPADLAGDRGAPCGALAGHRLGADGNASVGGAGSDLFWARRPRSRSDRIHFDGLAASSVSTRTAAGIFSLLQVMIDYPYVQPVDADDPGRRSLHSSSRSSRGRKTDGGFPHSGFGSSRTNLAGFITVSDFGEGPSPSPASGFFRRSRLFVSSRFISCPILHVRTWYGTPNSSPPSSEKAGQ